MRSVLKNKVLPLLTAAAALGLVIVGTANLASAGSNHTTSGPTLTVESVTHDADSEAMAGTAAAGTQASAAGPTAKDCKVTVSKPFVSQNRLYARTSVKCTQRHNIRLTSKLAWADSKTTLPAHRGLFPPEKDFRNFKGTAVLVSSVPCNTVSPRTSYVSWGSFSDITFLKPISIDGRYSGAAKGC
ncbi:hypothetical protein AB0J86_02830 [Micromonospora sp. NPDC049559]|uniref:hypothetical protein n=1 Tax=Micromonospora sp. NPDC049559 TaxID=3155923 RepID=UPI0034491CFE